MYLQAYYMFTKILKNWDIKYIVLWFSKLLFKENTAIRGYGLEAEERVMKEVVK